MDHSSSSTPHKSSVIIGPDAPTALKWFEFYEQRSVGRALGLAFVAFGSSSLVILSKPWTWFSAPSTTPTKQSSWKLLPVGLSIVALIVGLRLRIRKYYKDPAALQEYINTYHANSFSDSFRQFDSWEGLFRIATRTMMEAKVERELQGFVPGYPQITAPLTFDQAWQLYNEVSGHPKLLEQMIQKQILNVSALRALAMADLESSFGSPNPLAASAPPMDDNLGNTPTRVPIHFGRWPGLPNPHEPRTILSRILTYGDFLQSQLGIPASVLQAALSEDSEVIRMSFDQLIQSGVRKLLEGTNPLFSAELLRQKGIQHIQQRGLTWNQVFSDYGRWLLDEDILHPADLEALFRRDCIGKLDAVTLISEWYDWPIVRYGHSLGLTPAELSALNLLHKQLEDARSSLNSAITSITAKHNANMNKALVQHELSLKNLKPAESKPLGANEIPIVHKGSQNTNTTGGSEQMAAAEKARYEAEKAELEANHSEQESEMKSRYTKVEKEINDYWHNVLFPKPTSEASSTNVSSPVQLNLNFSLFNGVSTGK